MSQTALLIDDTAPVINELRVVIEPVANATELLLTMVAPGSINAFWQHPNWWLLADKHLFNGVLKVILVTGKNGNLVAALPVQSTNGLLVSPRHCHLTILDSIWPQPVSSHQIETVMDTILQKSNAWGWNNTIVPDISEVSQCRQEPMWQWRESRQSAWFDTTGEVPVPGKLRRNLARHERHLQESGILSYSVCNAMDVERTAKALNNFLQLEAAGWKGECGTAIDADPSLSNFYLALTNLHSPDLLFEIHQLHLQERCIAIQIGLRCGASLYLLKIAYDEAHHAYSPGSLLLWHTLQHCVETSVESLSLVSSPEWAARWKPQTFPVWEATRFANSLQGALHQKAASLKNNVKDQLRTTRDRIRP